MPYVYKTLEQMNASGIAGILTTNSAATSLFPAMFIFSLWTIISLGNFYAMTRRYGTGDFFASILVGGFVASILSGICMIIPNFMPLLVTVITILLEIILFIIFITEKQLRNE